MLKHVISFLFMLISMAGFAQVNAGDDITISAGLPIELIGGYEGSIGNPVTATDDGYVGPFDIGFEFTFFGETHEQFAVGPNGLISFDVPDIIGNSYFYEVTIPTSEPYFQKAIMSPYQDLFARPINPHSGYIYYKTVGSIGDRRLIVGWCEAPMFGCSSIKASYQIVLHESDNRITNHLISKPYCNNNANLATHGLNLHSTLAVPVPGRNETSWTAEQETWEFLPDGPDNYLVDEKDFEPEVIVPIGKLSWAWYKDKYPGGEMISDEKSVIVHPTEKTIYFCEITTCSGLIYVDDITINAIPAPNAFNPNSLSSENREFKFYTDQPERIKNFVLYIYNRWGQLVFETEDFEKGWDGTYNGQDCSAGDYVWTIYYKGVEESSTSKGIVTLVK